MSQWRSLENWARDPLAAQQWPVGPEHPSPERPSPKWPSPDAPVGGLGFLGWGLGMKAAPEAGMGSGVKETHATFLGLLSNPVPP